MKETPRARSLAMRVREICEHHPRARALATDFATQHELLGAVLPKMRYLADRRHYAGDAHARNQQAEITYALSTWGRNSKSVTFTSAQLLAMANATRDVTHTLAIAMRREMVRDNTNLGRAHPVRRTRVTTYSKHHALYFTLTELARVPAPTKPISEYVAPLQRAALRSTLDLTPTDGATPRPFHAPSRPGVER